MTMGITVCAWAVRDGTYHNHDEEISSSCEIVRLIVLVLLNPNRSLEIFRAKSQIIAGCSIVIASIY